MCVTGLNIENGGPMGLQDCMKVLIYCELLLNVLSSVGDEYPTESNPFVHLVHLTETLFEQQNTLPYFTSSDPPLWHFEDLALVV